MIQAIKDLCQEGFADEYLPVYYVDVGDDIFMESCRDDGLGRKRPESFSRKPWNFREVIDFCNSQWLVQSPLFDEQAKQYYVDERCALPFIHVEKAT